MSRPTEHWHQGSSCNRSAKPPHTLVQYMALTCMYKILYILTCTHHMQLPSPLLLPPHPQGDVKVARRGYWGDIVNSPFVSIGTESNNEELFKKANGKYVKVSHQGANNTSFSSAVFHVCCVTHPLFYVHLLNGSSALTAQ